MRIPDTEISLERTSGADEVGVVFRWRGEVYRAIAAQYEVFYRQLLDSPLYGELTTLGMVETEITEHRIDGFDLVVKPKTIPVVSYPTEWTSAMLKDAAMMTCDIELRLLRSGYTLKDAHPWNILFDGWRPVFVDIGSICAKGPAPVRTFLHEFRTDFLYPLLFLDSEASPLVDVAMNAYLGLPKLPIYRLLFWLMPMRHWLYHFGMDRKARRVARRSPEAAVEILRRQIERLPGHHGEKNPVWSLSGVEADWERSVNTALGDIVDKLRPTSVLKIGADESWYRLAAACCKSRVIIADADDDRANRIYERVKNERLNSLVLKVDPILASPPHDRWGIHRPAEERLRCDVVFMFNTARYFEGRRKKRFSDVAWRLSRFSRKAALVGYKPAQYGDSEGSAKTLTLASARETLGEYFEKVCSYAELDRDRWMLLCLEPRRNTDPELRERTKFVLKE